LLNISSSQWGCAIAGISAQLLVDDLPLVFKIGTYLFMGWYGVIFYPIISRELPGLAIRWLLIGGLFYSFGVIFLLWDSLHFNHTIWHLLVIIASVSHYITVVICYYFSPGETLEGMTTTQILVTSFSGTIKEKHF
jgi:channel protein (hemolysin III family)